MKTFLQKILVLILIIGNGHVFSQNQNRDWVDMKEDPSVNFYKVQDAFYEYWENKDMEEDSSEEGERYGYKQFKRWENFVEPRVYPSGDRGVMSKGYNEYIKQREKYKQKRSLKGKWNYIGNKGVPTSGGGAGRANCIQFNPNDHSEYYVGAASGGLWLTEDDGDSWKNLTDNLPVLGISDIAIDPRNTKVVYIATGDKDGSDTYSAGIWKTTDKGKSWEKAGLNWKARQQNLIHSLLIHPN
ncbi:MAG: WD40/YVTN/BNR-like repeat-containing protein, partial [Flavobacteriales bacterium]